MKSKLKVNLLNAPIVGGGCSHMSSKGNVITISDSVNVMCHIDSVSECSNIGKMVDDILGRLKSSNILPSKPKVLVVVTKGISVLVMSAFEVLRKYDGVASISLDSDLSNALFQALHDIVELYVRKHSEAEHVSRWVVEGLASAVALEGLRLFDEAMFKRVYNELKSKGCVSIDELFSWRHPVEIRGLEVIEAAGGKAEEAAKRVADIIRKSLPLELLAHLRGEDIKFYTTSALLMYEIGKVIGFDKLVKLEVPEDELRRAASEVYQRVCS